MDSPAALLTSSSTDLDAEVRERYALNTHRCIAVVSAAMVIQLPLGVTVQVLLDACLDMFQR